jgi:uncharacterized protein (TIGR02646 family)
MKVIRKGKEPRSLTSYRAQPIGTNYESFPGKQELREALAKEQGHICCYCMGRICPNEKQMKIEHWASQEKHPELQLSYGNMLGACPGNMGAPRDAQHCDTFKGATDIKLKPTDAATGWERAIHYSRADGRIWSENEEHDRELNEGGLNLNIDLLKEARLAAWRGVEEGIARKHPGPWTAAIIQRYIADYEGLQQGRHAEYCAAVVYFLKKRLARSAPKQP